MSWLGKAGPRIKVMKKLGKVEKSKYMIFTEKLPLLGALSTSSRPGQILKKFFFSNIGILIHFQFPSSFENIVCPIHRNISQNKSASKPNHKEEINMHKIKNGSKYISRLNSLFQP